MFLELQNKIMNIYWQGGNKTIKAKKYYTKITGVVTEVIPFAYSRNLFEKDGGSVFCTFGPLDEGAPVIRLTPDLISTRRGGFDKNNRSKQDLRLHFAKTLPPYQAGTLRLIGEALTLDQVSKLLGSDAKAL